MTTLIQQKSGNDCTLASIAMALGKDKWEDIWKPADLDEVLGKGVSDLDTWLGRAGLGRSIDYQTVYTHGVASGSIAAFLWKRRALVSAHSVNNSFGNHMVYWDGDRVWDPNEGRDGMTTIKHLRSVVITTVILLA